MLSASSPVLTFSRVMSSLLRSRSSYIIRLLRLLYRADLVFYLAEHDIFLRGQVEAALEVETGQSRGVLAFGPGGVGEPGDLVIVRQVASERYYLATGLGGQGHIAGIDRIP